MCTGRWHARWHSQGQSGQLHAGSLRGRVSHSHPHKGTVHTHVNSTHCLSKGLSARRQGLMSVRPVLCVTRKVEQRPRGEVWFSLSAGILLSSSQMLSLTRKGPKCALLPLLERWDVAAAVWVTWRLPRRRRKSTRSDQLGQGMQQPGGRGASWPRSGHASCCGEKSHQLGSTEKGLPGRGTFLVRRALKNNEMILAELNMG